MTPKILCVGLVCVDIIQICQEFPTEDTDRRSLACHWTRGGNASNNCTVLSLLGAPCGFLGTVANNLFWENAKEDFDHYQIDHSQCIVHDGSYEFPLSTVIINAKNGSRTIIHSNQNLPGLTAEDFNGTDIENYEWIHFEGRDRAEYPEILKAAEERTSGRHVTISVELEKSREGLLGLAKYANVVFIGKDFAAFNGWMDMKTAIDGMRKHVKPKTAIICTWGEKGASAFHDDVGHVEAPSYPPRNVVDTLGAGDTFLAATIFQLWRKQPLQEAIDFGCRMAGAKVGARGYDVIKDACRGLAQMPQ